MKERAIVPGPGRASLYKSAMAALFCYHLLPACLGDIDERPHALLARAVRTQVQGFVTHQAYVAQVLRGGPQARGQEARREARLALLCALDLNPVQALLAPSAAVGRGPSAFVDRWNAYNRMAPLGVNTQLDGQGALRRESPMLPDRALRAAAQRSADIRAGIAASCVSVLARGGTSGSPADAPRTLQSLARRLGCANEVLDLLAWWREEPALALPDAARRLGRSARQLQRDLARHGLGFATLRQAARIEHAQQALLGGTASLTGIAHAAGFFDSAHFVHGWQRACGVSPSQYRQLAGRQDARGSLCAPGTVRRGVDVVENAQ